MMPLRIKHNCLTFCTLLLWVACITVVVIWISSYRLEGYLVSYRSQRMYIVFFLKGRLEFQTVGQWDAPNTGSWHNFYRLDPPPTYAREFLHLPEKPWYWLGFSCYASDIVINNRSGTVASRSRPLTGLVVPHWFLFLATLLFAIGWQFRLAPRWIISDRRHRGLCLTCAYDLRATKNRCPECGTATLPVPAKSHQNNPHPECTNSPSQ